MNYAAQQRIRMIDFLLEHYGYVQRGTIMDFFGISSPCASRDLAVYLELAPQNMHYNGSTKRWERAKSFQRLL